MGGQPEHVRKSVLNPVRVDVVKLLKSGYVLTTTDVMDVCRKYGVNPGNYINLGLSAGAFRNDTGINVGTKRYQRRVLFYDASIPVEDTDMDRVLKIIDSQPKPKSGNKKLGEL